MSSSDASDRSSSRPPEGGARVPAMARHGTRGACRKEFEDEERVPRQRAAERLVDIAYALTGGDMLDLRHDGRQVSVPVADEVLLTRSSTATGDRVEVDVRLSWSTTRPHTKAETLRQVVEDELATRTQDKQDRGGPITHSS